MTLEPRIIEELHNTQKELEAAGRLPSAAQLLRQLEAFRERFAPEKLANLDGEALLEAMHNHSTRDSLVYWLEFKEDEEFHTSVFGSIAGGSALKFGIYRRKETGAWMTGSPQQQHELSLPEAIERARSHRDQLLTGARLLADLPAQATETDYARLQDEMDKLKPVGDTAWGHKYWSLLFPEKLDAFHSVTYQRFNLLRVLQPLPKKQGRYLFAPRYVALARELALPSSSLMTVLGRRNGTPYRYWRVGTSIEGGTRDGWPLMRDSGCVAIGYSGLGDLSAIGHTAEGRERIRRLMTAHHPSTPSAVSSGIRQVFNFVAVMAEGDVVLAADEDTILGIGKVVGPYAYDPSSGFAHRRPVQWLSLEEWRMPTPEGLQTTVHEIERGENLVEVERRILERAPSRPDTTPQAPLPELTGIPARVQSILERKGQVILYGPPGTGKTFWAQCTAQELAARAAFRKPVADLRPEERAVVVGNGQDELGLVRMCTFHPAYGYEDFIEGYRPTEANGQLVFERRDGIFKRLCADAAQDPTRRYYLIIDEINRGDIPRIFGELLTILEKDKRKQALLLPLSGSSFAVPENVYLLGTMNTADRSIALLDTALRRRFGFIELMPDSSLLAYTVVGGVPLGPWLDALNQRLCENIGRDARNLQIGHAYLLEAGRPISSLAQFARVLRDDIIPLLEEYCYENYEALERILGHCALYQSLRSRGRPLRPHASGLTRSV